MSVLRSLAATVALMMSSGCLWLDDGGGYGYDSLRAPGDVTFTWSFVNGYCEDRPEVRDVRVVIPGQVLENNGVFPCNVNGYPGIRLYDFDGGGYSYTVEAHGWNGALLYSANGGFVVDGSVSVNVDLMPFGVAPSYAYLYWSFPPNAASSNPSCAQAGITFVDVTIDGDTLRYTCEAGQVAEGALTDYLNPGLHNIDLVAVDLDGYPYYAAQSTLTTLRNQPVSADYALDWAVGGAAVRAQLYLGSRPVSCASAGYPTLAVNFADAQGNLLYGPSGDLGADGQGYACGDSVVYWFLPPGTYRVVMDAVGPSGAYVSAGNAPFVTVVAGVFRDASQAVTVPLYR
ncbi:MAG: hypothetical protein ACKVPX_05535 [Myxococcaceae bacterium]